MLRFHSSLSFRRWVRRALPLCVVLSCRATDVAAPPELTNGTPVSVRFAVRPDSGMAHSVVDIAAVGDSVRVLWRVDASDCLRASASAGYAERLLLIEIARSGDPLMDCVPGTNPKRYEATTAALPSGTYD